MPTKTTTRGKPIVKRAEDGFAIYGMEPPELAQSHGFFRLMFWKWVLLFALKAKDRELSRGLDKDGKPLRPISPQTRKTRRSAMTPSGKGDPSAPPLIPGWQKSRTRSLLTGRAYEDHVDLFWKFDAFTHNSWSKILEYQAENGRDVFGLSAKALQLVQRQAWARWDAYKGGRFEEPDPRKVQQPAEPKPEVIGGAVNIRGKTAKEWTAYFRQTAPAYLPGRPIRPKAVSPISGPQYNVLLSHIYGVTREGPPPRPPKMTPPRPKLPRAPVRPVKPPPPPEPGQFTHIDQAAAWMTKTFPNADVKLTGIPVESWNHITQELSSLAKKWPKVAAKLKQLGTHEENWRGIDPERAFAIADPIKGHFLSFGPHRWQSLQTVTDAVTESSQSGWFVGGITDPNYIVAHEWGHLVDAHFRNTDRVKLFHLKTVFSDKPSALDWNKSAAISKYATTSRDEAFAEAFAALRYQPPSLFAAVVKALQTLLK